MPGIESFKGHSFHTSRWDYDYTGGDPLSVTMGGAPLSKLADKRVAIIGTGATAVQCVPHLARGAGTLYVFQRTPSSVDVRGNVPLDPDWFASIATPGWQKRWLENFTANQGGGWAEEDLVQDGWTELSRRIRSRLMQLPEDARTPQNMWAAFEDSDFEKMEEIRARCDAIVGDPETAEKLKAWYRQLCKRPCFHDEYLQAFNEPGAHLIDTDGQGVERITEKGVVAGGREYEVDCIIYASGFEVGTEYRRRAGFDLVGRGGLKLSEAWAEGMRSKHGIHVHGFPNAFFVQPTQGANLISNVPHNLTEAGQTIAAIVRHAQDEAAQRGRGHQGGRGRLGGAAAHRHGPDDRLARLHARLLQQRGPGPRPGGAPRRRLPGRRLGLLQVHRRMAELGRLRGPGISLISAPPRRRRRGVRKPA